MESALDSKRTGHSVAPRLSFSDPGRNVPVLPLYEVADFVREKVRGDEIFSLKYISTANIFADFGGAIPVDAPSSLEMATRFCPGDILVSNIRPYLKKVWRADIYGAASNDVIVIRAKPGVDGFYLSALLCSDLFVRYAMLGAKGVKMPRGEISMIRNFPVPCPSIDEQEKVAGCLGALNELLAEKVRKLSALWAYKAGLVAVLFPKEGGVLPVLRFTKFEGDWKTKRIGDFLKESRVEGGYGDEARKITVRLWGKGVVAKREALKGSRSTRYYKRKSGQFIYSKLDFLNQAFGIIPEDLDGYESTADLPSFDIGAGLDGGFFLEYVKRDAFYKKNGEMADGGRKAKRIQVDDFLSFSIVTPREEGEQQSISACLSSIDDLIVEGAREIEAIRDHKLALVEKLFPMPNGCFLKGASG